MSREWESEQLEGLTGFWVVEGSSRGSSSEGKFRIEDIVFTVLWGISLVHWRHLEGNWIWGPGSIMRAGERLETQVSECLPYGE